MGIKNYPFIKILIIVYMIKPMTISNNTDPGINKIEHLITIILSSFFLICTIGETIIIDSFIQ